MAPAGDPVTVITAGERGPGVGAFFDLDGTLLAGFTATAHAGERIRRGQARLGEVLGVLEVSLRYKLGRIEFGPLLTRAASYLHGESLAELERICDRLFAEQLESKVYPQMRRIVSAHRDMGHTLLLCSSALSIHAHPAARALGIADIVCNTFELSDGDTLTGRVNRPIIWGDRKAAAVQRFCADRNVELARSYFYADGDEDAALMAMVGYPRPVNPRPGLTAMAAEHDWPVLHLRAPDGGAGAASALGHLPGLGRAALTRGWHRLTSRGAGRR